MTLNKNAFTFVVLFLGVGLILCLGGVVYLNASGNSVDDILKQAITGIVTGLIGLLARTPEQPPVGGGEH